MQIRTRLTLLFLLIEATILALTLLFVYFQYKDLLEKEFFSELRARATATAAMAVGRIEQEHTTEVLTESNRLTPSLLAAENIFIFNEYDRLIYSFEPSHTRNFKKLTDCVRREGEMRYQNDDGKTGIGQFFLSSSGKKYIVLAESTFDATPLHEMAQRLMLIFLVLLIISALIGWLFVQQAFAPINQIMNQVDALHPNELHRRLSPPLSTDELGRLTETFNRLLGRIEKAFLAQKMFISNLSHELRNPLTIIITQIEVARAQPRSAEEYEHTLDSLLADTRALHETAEKLMQLAKLNAADPHIEFSPVRIDELLWQLKKQLTRSHPDYSVHFEIGNLPDNEAHLSIPGNEILLRSALLNLMENACKFSSDHAVQVLLNYEEKPSPQISIEFADHGPGITEAELPLIFEPFFRGDAAQRVKGSGVGLSLVRSVVELHGGRISVRNANHVGAVFRVELKL